MNSYLRFFLRFSLFILVGYIAVCALVYFNQESLLFHPERVSSKEQYDFGIPYSEKRIQVERGIGLHGVLFETPQPKGLVFFVHGNSGNVSDLKGPAEFYTGLGYDFFTFDYRGFGKSNGIIANETVFYQDVQLVYNALKKSYPEKTIIVAGYSVGTAAAAKLAAENNPKKLLLMAPYYSMEELAGSHYPFIPGFLVHYKFETFRFLQQVKVPVLIGHGTNDGTIPLGQSLKLKRLLKQSGRYVVLTGEGHNGVQNNPEFELEIARFLEK